MAYNIQINEYQRALIEQCLKTAMEHDGPKLATLPGQWQPDAKDELRILIEMIAPGELAEDPAINGLCI